MIGLGCGARSYTRELHYASDYAVGRAGVRAILSDYAARSRESFTAADFGVRLNEDEQRRRYVIKSILRVDGLDVDSYNARFGADVSTDLPALDELLRVGLACTDGARLCLTAAGLELSDAIGPWLYSDAIRNRMEAYELR
jgi:oxygen-independent coproporphyrinogen-3 oxidase